MTLDQLCDLFPEWKINRTSASNSKDIIYKLRGQYMTNPQLMSKTIDELIQIYTQKLPELTPYETKRKALQEMTEFALFADNIENTEVIIFLDKPTQKEINKVCLLLLVQNQYYGPLTNAISIYCGNLRGLELGMHIFDDLIQEQPKYLQ